MTSPSPSFQLSHLHLRAFSQDWSLAFINSDKHMIHVGVKPTLTKSCGRVSFDYADSNIIGYVQYKIPLANEIYLSNKVSTRKNVGMAIEHVRQYKNFSSELVCGVSTSSFNTLNLVCGASLTFEMK
jgi:hypothetical protein